MPKSQEITDKAKLKDRLVVPFAGFAGHCEATDYIEFDIATGENSLPRGFYYSPFKGNDNNSIALEFRRGEGIDQFGRDQSSGPETKGGPGAWEHRVVGLCSVAPGILPRHGLVFQGGKPGTYTVYLDNLRIRHADDTTTPIWTNGKDTRYRSIADSESFVGTRVRSVPAHQVQ